MQQSSSSIGALAAALAKAQAELVNPEKSMIATIRSDDKGGAEQIFRYAPLSSGLEILRKTLGQHEIAILQATAIDQAAGVVKLTTNSMPFKWRMGGLDLAGLRHRGNGEPQKNGRGAHLRAAYTHYSRWSGLRAKTILTLPI